MGFGEAAKCITVCGFTVVAHTEGVGVGGGVDQEFSGCSSMNEMSPSCFTHSLGNNIHDNRRVSMMLKGSSWSICFLTDLNVDLMSIDLFQCCSLSEHWSICSAFSLSSTLVILSPQNKSTLLFLKRLWLFNITWGYWCFQLHIFYVLALLLTQHLLRVGSGVAGVDDWPVEVTDGVILQCSQCNITDWMKPHLFSLSPWFLPLLFSFSYCPEVDYSEWHSYDCVTAWGDWCPAII